MGILDILHAFTDFWMLRKKKKNVVSNGSGCQQTIYTHKLRNEY